MVVRLLPRSEIDKRKAEEQRTAIQEGLKVAERIDTLRETAASEEVAFERYRIESLRGIQEEINAKHAEKEALEKDVSTRKAELQELFGPLDQAWMYYVKSEKARIEQQVKDNETLASQSTRTTLEAQKAAQESKELAEKLASERLHYESLTASAKEKEQEAIQVLVHAKNTADKIARASEITEQKAKERLNKAIEYEQRLDLEAQRLAEVEKDIRTREFKVLAKELQFYSPIKKI